ncbi:hypothetical protein HELRODRAFT_159928 [Helobdella robusta]|uniref:ENPP1-3/EXOG-like endonuclease/phosphodiesterase domain-containing protein n=1 Tax=Helobdella robusta TaxID=6412 RepID=T1EPK5_HELRO|nr:hypothetical protein HELRODRAFT_159928 [Helobdella robusta]ESO05851.1 hypothetical protein HELRODRAFT_159928 [Helobdella robusta]
MVSVEMNEMNSHGELANEVLLCVGVGIGLGITWNDTRKTCFVQPQKLKGKINESEVFRIKQCVTADTLKCPKGKSHPPLIILSLDGFRAEYLLRNMTPNLEKIKNCGVHSPYMRAAFPTRKFTVKNKEKLDKRWYQGEAVNGNLSYVDNLVGRLVNGMIERGYGECMNIIIVADHGMEKIDCGRTINITKFLTKPEAYYVYDGVRSRMTSKYLEDEKSKIFFINKNPVPVVETLQELQCRDYNTTKDWYSRVHRKQELPKRYHYSNNPYIDDIVFDIQPRYYLGKFTSPKCHVNHGSHGSDNTFTSMHAIFLGMGSLFKGMEVEAFESIELYNLYADLTNLRPSPNNGSYGSLHHILNTTNINRTLSFDNDYDNDANDVDSSRNFCKYPDQSDERNKRRRTSGLPSLPSTCFSATNEENLDKEINLKESDKNTSLKFNLPLKMYQIPNSIKYCSMVQRRTCIRADVRDDNMVNYENIYGKENKDNESIVMSLLFPPGYYENEPSSADAHTTSNAVPMYVGFQEGVWKELLHLIEEYSEKYRHINVVLGPIFDYNSDGLKDTDKDITKYVDSDGTIPIPSHYFTAVFKCEGGDCETVDDVISFVLPHKPDPQNCWTTTRDVFSGKLWDGWSWDDASDPGMYPDVKLQCPAGPDYLDRKLTPVLEKLRNSGVTSESMSSIYPSLTFPNHNSIITGLYPESHGIIDNIMYDSQLNKTFNLGSPNQFDTRWWIGEPLWETVIKQNKTAYTFFWPGADVEIHGKYPTKYVKYQSAVPHSLRVDTVLDWLKNGSVDLMTLYFSRIDEAGHRGGPVSVQVNESLVDADESLKKLMDGIFRMKLHNCINIIIVSDHVQWNADQGVEHAKNFAPVCFGGAVAVPCQVKLESRMSPTHTDRSLNISRLLSPNDRKRTYIYEGASSRISTTYTYGAKSDLVTEIAPENQSRHEYGVTCGGADPDVISATLNCKVDQMVSYNKREVAKRYHYVTSNRIDDVILMVKDTWQAFKDEPWDLFGNHGWDPQHKSMEALFVAFGPSFKSRKSYKGTFENIELYNLMSHLLGVRPSPNNGTAGSLNHFLKNETSLPVTSSSGYENCTFPRNENDLKARTNFSVFGCSEQKYEFQRLNKSDSERKFLLEKHLDHGTPKYSNHTSLITNSNGTSSSSSNVCILHQNAFVSAFNKNIRLPLWSAYRYVQPSSGSHPDVCPSLRPDKLIPDPRLTQNEQIGCQEWTDLHDDGSGDYTPVSLIKEWSSSSEDDSPDTKLLTNIVPMHKKMYSETWCPLMAIIGKYSPRTDVVLGPIFDYDSDGLIDSNINKPCIKHIAYDRTVKGIPIPSHYYAILLPVQKNVGTPNFDSIAFVIPNNARGAKHYCQTSAQFITENRARIRDIELLTNLEFLTKTPAINQTNSSSGGSVSGSNGSASSRDNGRNNENNYNIRTRLHLSKKSWKDFEFL